MDRCWLLTWTTYGAWLPGDERGFVGAVRDQIGAQATHNQPGTDYDRDRSHLRCYSKTTQKRESAKLTRQQADLVCRQLIATAEHRGWTLFAVAVMANHVHAVVGVPGDPDPSTLLRDFKGYSARALNQSSQSREPRWTKSGSTRKLRDDAAILAAIRYVENQEWPLAIWIRGESDRPGAPPA